MNCGFQYLQVNYICDVDHKLSITEATRINMTLNNLTRHGENVFYDSHRGGYRFVCCHVHFDLITQHRLGCHRRVDHTAHARGPVGRVVRVRRPTRPGDHVSFDIDARRVPVLVRRQ